MIDHNLFTIWLAKEYVLQQFRNYPTSSIWKLKASGNVNLGLVFCIVRDKTFENGGSTKKIKVEEEDISYTKPIDKSIKTEKMDNSVSRNKVKIEAGGPCLGNIKDTATMPDAAKVKELMAQAQKMIEERKKKLNIAPSKINPAQAEQFMVESLQSKSSRLDYLRNRVKASLNNLPLSLSNYQSFEKQQGAPKPLILDETGRTIDNRGHQIQLTQRTPTLKANIRAEKVANFNRAAQEVIQETYENRDEYAAAAYVDPRVPVKAAAREKRKLKFHQPGEFIAQAKKLRAQAKLEKLQQEVSLAAKRTGISSAVKLAMVAPKVAELTDTDVPNIEWWDSVILPGDW
uniref:Pre-mRNA-splicing factor 3 domain-containing protein n=1 Tax=Romanomermis culicivorax TaxID=13658 RepID=A0A915JLH2_ROMCU